MLTEANVGTLVKVGHALFHFISSSLFNGHSVVQLHVIRKIESTLKK
jgi:hypothetical protein